MDPGAVRIPSTSLLASARRSEQQVLSKHFQIATSTSTSSSSASSSSSTASALLTRRGETDAEVFIVEKTTRAVNLSSSSVSHPDMSSDFGRPFAIKRHPIKQESLSDSAFRELRILLALKAFLHDTNKCHNMVALLQWYRVHPPYFDEFSGSSGSNGSAYSQQLIDSTGSVLFSATRGISSDASSSHGSRSSSPASASEGRPSSPRSIGGGGAGAVSGGAGAEGSLSSPAGDNGRRKRGPDYMTSPAAASSSLSLSRGADEPQWMCFVLEYADMDLHAFKKVLREQQPQNADGDLADESSFDATGYRLEMKTGEYLRRILFHVCYALYVAQKELHFVHHDLHLKNVLVSLRNPATHATQPGPVQAFVDRSGGDSDFDVWFTDGVLACITDFGHSRLCLRSPTGDYDEVVYNERHVLSERYNSENDFHKVAREMRSLFANSFLEFDETYPNSAQHYSNLLSSMTDDHFGYGSGQVNPRKLLRHPFFMPLTIPPGSLVDRMRAEVAAFNATHLNPTNDESYAEAVRLCVKGHRLLVSASDGETNAARQVVGNSFLPEALVPPPASAWEVATWRSITLSNLGWDETVSRRSRAKPKVYDDAEFEKEKTPQQKRAMKKRQAAREAARLQQREEAAAQAALEAATEAAIQVFTKNTQPLRQISLFFKGISFVLTGYARENTSQLPPPDRQRSAQNGPLDRLRQICLFIETHGGHILHDISHLSKVGTNASVGAAQNVRTGNADPVPKVVLLSDRDQRTPKYMLAIILGIPLVHDSWVDWCVQRDALQSLQDFRLPVGHSESRSEYAYQEKPVEPFIDLRLEFVFPSNSLVRRTFDDSQWSLVFQKSGARLTNRQADLVAALSKRDAPNIDVLCCIGTAATDSKNALLIQKAEQFGIRLVSFEWCIQSIIDGEDRTIEADGDVNSRSRLSARWPGMTDTSMLLYPPLQEDSPLFAPCRWFPEESNPLYSRALNELRSLSEVSVKQEPVVTASDNAGNSATPFAGSVGIKVAPVDDFVDILSNDSPPSETGQDIFTARAARTVSDAGLDDDETNEDSKRQRLE